MKNVTISLDDSTYRRARIVAAEREVSLSGLVKKLLVELESGDGAERLRARERALRERVVRFRAADRLSRDEAHDRNA